MELQSDHEEVTQYSHTMVMVWYCVTGGRSDKDETFIFVWSLSRHQLKITASLLKLYEGDNGPNVSTFKNWVVLVPLEPTSSHIGFRPTALRNFFVQFQIP
jgi:hypothetical protein